VLFLRLNLLRFACFILHGVSHLGAQEASFLHYTEWLGFGGTAGEGLADQVNSLLAFLHVVTKILQPHAQLLKFFLRVTRLQSDELLTRHESLQRARPV